MRPRALDFWRPIWERRVGAFLASKSFTGAAERDEEVERQQQLLIERVTTLTSTPPEYLAGRGIVMAVGGRFIASAWVTLSLLRHVHRCRLPIEIWYLDDDDFTPELRRLFERFDVYFVDARTVKAASWLPHSGWELKPFALMHSRFAEVLLLDADNIPLIDPALLFDEPRYATHHALIWPDVRQINPFNPIWSIVGVKPPVGFELESGQLVVDKRHHWPTIQLAEHFSRHAQFYHRYVLGDKEAFHVAIRMLKARFALPSTPAQRAEGNLPGDPADECHPVGLWQHDFTGRRIFLHLTDVPLVAWGRNPEIPGFELATETEHALSTLRAIWDGSFPHPPSLGQIKDGTGSTPPGRFLYARRGLEQRILELLPTGRIGSGSAQTEAFWELDEEGQEQELIISGREGVTCRLRQAERGVWRGEWSGFEKTPVEMVPVAASTRHPVANLDSRPTLLFVSPVEPKDAGNGLAMRAANMLRTLVETHRVSLLIVPLYAVGASKTLPRWVMERCERVRWARRPESDPETDLPPELMQLRRSAWTEEAGRCYWGEQFDVIHVFRMSSLPFAERYLAEPANVSAYWHLDLDDVESRSGQRLANLYALHNLTDEAIRSAKSAQMSASFEHHVLQTWNRVYVCSPGDKDYLEEQVPERRAEIVAVPNRVSLPPHPVSPPRRPPFTILYVGTLDYFPNTDGAIWFCREVIPAMRELSAVSFRFVIVGTGAPAAVRDLAFLPDVEFVGEVPSVDEWYEQADVVVVPIRAGGGTRIKLLEAFAFKRPVVTTHMAAEGLDVEHGEHLLLAERPIPFARACLNLMSDAALAERLARNGRQLVKSHYALQPVLDVNVALR